MINVWNWVVVMFRSDLKYEVIVQWIVWENLLIYIYIRSHLFNVLTLSQPHYYIASSTTSADLTRVHMCCLLLFTCMFSLYIILPCSRRKSGASISGCLRRGMWRNWKTFFHKWPLGSHRTIPLTVCCFALGKSQKNYESGSRRILISNLRRS